MRLWGIIASFFLLEGITAQVPNGSFENWSSVNPDSWQTTNIPIVPVSVMADSDAIDGSLSVKGIVVSDNNNQPHPPYLGIAGGGSAGFSIPQPYQTVQGFIKLQLFPGDEFYVNVKIYDENQEAIAESIVTIDSSITSWTPISINLNYFGDSAHSCSMFFTITDQAGLASGHIGSYFLLDFITMAGAVGIESPLDASIKVFPNPVHENLNISIPETCHLASISLYDVSGKNVYDKHANDHEQSIMVANLSKGNYLLDMVVDEKHVVRKVLIE